MMASAETPDRLCRTAAAAIQSNCFPGIQQTQPSTQGRDNDVAAQSLKTVDKANAADKKCEVVEAPDPKGTMSQGESGCKRQSNPVDEIPPGTMYFVSFDLQLDTGKLLPWKPSATNWSSTGQPLHMQPHADGCPQHAPHVCEHFQHHETGMEQRGHQVRNQQWQDSSKSHHR
jgi:hypothetical protein